MHKTKKQWKINHPESTKRNGGAVSGTFPAVWGKDRRTIYAHCECLKESNAQNMPQLFRSSAWEACRRHVSPVCCLRTSRRHFCATDPVVDEQISNKLGAPDKSNRHLCSRDRDGWLGVPLSSVDTNLQKHGSNCELPSLLIKCQSITS